MTKTMTIGYVDLILRHVAFMSALTFFYLYLSKAKPFSRHQFWVSAAGDKVVEPAFDSGSWLTCQHSHVSDDD